MSFKNLNIKFILPLLCTTLLLAVACDKTPVVTLESDQTAPEQTEPTPETSEKAEQAPIESIQTKSAAMRDKFQLEANENINIENAESVLNDIEREINEELAELDKPTPTE